MSAQSRLADLDAVVSALNHPSRRQVLLILHMRGGEMTSGDIADRFSCTWPTTSRHLSKLEQAGLVQVERVGREAVYRIDRARLSVLGAWLAWFGEDATE